MSSGTQCNFCTLEGIRAYAAQTRQEVWLGTVVHVYQDGHAREVEFSEPAPQVQTLDGPGIEGWVEVYTRAPGGVALVWCASFMALTDRCVC